MLTTALYLSNFLLTTFRQSSSFLCALMVPPNFHRCLYLFFSLIYFSLFIASSFPIEEPTAGLSNFNFTLFSILSLISSPISLLFSALLSSLLYTLRLYFFSYSHSSLSITLNISSRKIATSHFTTGN